MHRQVTNEKKIFRILVKQNMNRKIARIIKISLTKLGGGGSCPPLPPPRTPMQLSLEKKPAKVIIAFN